jgi:putative endonuclease
MNQNREYGNMGEDAAASFLEKKGFEIIERNYRFGKVGELDIISKKGKLLIFVEVKYRTGSRYGGHLYSINRKKKNTIKKIAMQFLAANPDLYAKEITCRFDLIGIDNGIIDWVEDIIR